MEKKIKNYSIFPFDPLQSLSSTIQISSRFWQKLDSLFDFFTARGITGVIIFASLHYKVKKPAQSQDTIIHTVCSNTVDNYSNVSIYIYFME